MDPLVAIALVLLAGLIFLMIMGSRSKGPEKPKTALLVGHFYSLQKDPSGFEVVRVLFVDDDGVHIKVYRNKFSTRPSLVNPSDLVLGHVDDTDGFGLIHLPLKKQAFFDHKPLHLMPGPPPTDEEMWGYEVWQKNGSVLY